MERLNSAGCRSRVKSCVCETKARTNQCVAAKFVAGRDECPATVPKEGGRHGADPICNASHSQRAFPHKLRRSWFADS